MTAQTTLGHYGVAPTTTDGDCAECAALPDGFPCAVCYIHRDAEFAACDDCAALPGEFPCFDCYAAGDADLPAV